MKNTTIKYSNHAKYYPMLVISLCAFFLFYKYILQVYPSIMSTQLMAHFHVHGAGLGNLAATFFYTYVVTQFFVGPLLDKYSPRLLTAIAIMLCALGIFFFAKAQSLTVALLSRSLIGIGVAFATVSYMKFAAMWFKAEHFAVVGGLLATAAMLGSMVGQAPLSLLVTQVGWRESLVFCSLLGAILACLFYVVVRDRETPQTLKQNNHVNFSDVVSVLARRENLLLMLYSGLSFSPLAVLGGLWGNPFLQTSYHISQTYAATLTSFMFAGLAVGAPVLGYVADKINNPMRVMRISIVIEFCALSLVIYGHFQSHMLLALCLFIFGFATGAFMLGFAVGKDLNPIKMAATVIGLINTGDAAFGAVTEPFIGKILDTFWQGKLYHGAHIFGLHDYHIALSVLPLYLLTGFIVLLLLKPYKLNRQNLSSARVGSS